MSSYPIDPQVLRRAAKQILEIEEAGFGLTLDREINEQLWEDETRAEQNALRWELQLCLSNVNNLANRLVDLLQCPQEQALAVAIEVMEYRTKRAIVLEILPKMANDIKRKRFAGRSQS